VNHYRAGRLAREYYNPRAGWLVLYKFAAGTFAGDLSRGRSDHVLHDGRL